MFIFGVIVGSVSTICIVKPELPIKILSDIKKKYYEYCMNTCHTEKTNEKE